MMASNSNQNLIIQDGNLCFTRTLEVANFDKNPGLVVTEEIVFC